ncbi:MAG: hypothetical protein OEW35_13830 [Gammaproteobacteria bacterium]|nr:hypothetical protein [Gammaproteobacteria bacterium]MDH4255525.1 hypothetical protein [Gammaproteobacteria bacterium]MDH5311291.1 hypothetical protein [Gammaproteobacteria bacterium]
MSQAWTRGLPPIVLLLDALGTLLLIAGLYGRFGNPENAVLPFVGNEAISLVFIVTGLLCMVPLLIVVKQRATQGKR